ncbi:MAG: adenylate/guanylate cyclase domain-containing protein [Geminicoccaceae bacterium]
MDVAGWLDSLGLGQYARTFADNEIDAALLPALTADDLKDLGVVAVGHRRRLLEAIGELRATPTGPPLEQGERRQVCVLFADLVGYTALASALDAEEVHALLGAFFQTVDRLVVEHGGHVDKHIGDCVMAVFGAPVAHGDDAARAVAAALAIRDAVPGLTTGGAPLRVHVGVAGGQVVASGTGSAMHREYTVTGDTVNLASRLADAAAPGEILVSPSVRVDLAGRLDAEDRGELAVKGLVAPVRAWRVAGLEQVGVERSPLAGRVVEVAQLRALLAAVAATGRGGVALVRGEPGIGKSRLIDEARRDGLAQGLACHIVWSLDFGGATGRDPVRSLLRSLLALGDGAGAPDVVARLLAEGSVAQEDQVFLNDLLDLPQPTSLRAIYEAMDNGRRNLGKRAVMARLVDRASRSQPLLLVVEDVHWADPIALAHLARLAALTGTAPCVLLMTTRVDGDPIDAGWRGQAEGAALVSIDLGPLPAADSLQLAQRLLTGSGDLAARCVERAAGNPLFIEQLARFGQESSGVVPGTVQSLVQARLDRLNLVDKMALQAAAVLGQRFDKAALSHLLDRPDYDPDPLVGRQLLLAHDGAELRFSHALVRDAVYDSLLRSRRRELHGRAAAWHAARDPVLRAEHLDRAEAAEAAEAYLDAARAQLGEYRMESARALLERGLHLAREAGDVVALACLLGQTLLDLGSVGDAAECYGRALAQALDDAARCEAWLGLAACKRMAEDLPGAQAEIELAEATALRCGSDELLARSHFLAGNLCFPRGDIEGCLAHHRQSLGYARACGSAQHEAAALGGLGDADYVRGRMLSARASYERCLELCGAQGLGRIAAAHRQMLGLTRFFGGDVRAALADALAAMAAARQIGQPRGEMVAHMIAAEMHANLMQLDAAMEHLAAVEQLIAQIGAARFEPLRLNCLAKTLRARNRWAEAVPLLRRSVEASRATSLAFSGPSALGALALTTDDAEERRGAVAEGERLLVAGSLAHNHFRFYRDTIDAALRVAEWDEADRLADALAAFAAPEPLPWTSFYAARGRALARWGRGDRSPALRSHLAGLAGEGAGMGLLLAVASIERALTA